MKFFITAVDSPRSYSCQLHTRARVTVSRCGDVCVCVCAPVSPVTATAAAIACIVLHILRLRWYFPSLQLALNSAPLCMSIAHQTDMIGLCWLVWHLCAPGKTTPHGMAWLCQAPPIYPFAIHVSVANRRMCWWPHQNRFFVSRVVIRVVGVFRRHALHTVAASQRAVGWNEFRVSTRLEILFVEERNMTFDASSAVGFSVE